MKANRVSIHRLFDKWIVRFHMDDKPYRQRAPRKASLARLMDLCNGDAVNVFHFMDFDRINLEIHRNQPRRVDDSRSKMWKEGRTAYA